MHTIAKALQEIDEIADDLPVHGTLEYVDQLAKQLHFLTAIIRTNLANLETEPLPTNLLVPEED